ncbi:NAD(P)H-dependent flavin oxidoreductase [Solimonas marina]|uniref:Nitronate monooxygenase n=1 Tax=Solimonas marina TaxID=2714601 RepID=A0A970B555_9GAMM|nr:nitronate monooxygenase family protein [Solimonas marina]NKF21185.1 nitronate monooxygenase [Solimonas marina]
MTRWPDTRISDLLRIEHPLIQAPMAGAQTAPLAIAAARAGALGALPCAMLSAAQIRAELAAFRAALPTAPLNLNFFCHTPPHDADAALARWQARLAPYYAEFGISTDAQVSSANRQPFDDAACALVEDLQPGVVSFHFGLPDAALLARVQASGAKVLASATTVAEGRWLAARGVDAIIAQGSEAGGHRGLFLSDDVATQPGLFALLPQLVDAVDVPVIAAGGIGDARGIAAAFALGAAAVQIGTAYLYTPETRIAALHRDALAAARDDNTALTNVFSGRPARGLMNRVMRELGPLSADAPPFPLAGTALAPLRAATEAGGSGDFQSLWAGQAAALSRTLARGLDAEALTRALIDGALQRIGI